MVRVEPKGRSWHLGPVQRAVATVAVLTPMDTRQIAAFLGMRRDTVRTQLHAIYRKVRVRERTGLLLWALETNFIEITDPHPADRESLTD